MPVDWSLTFRDQPLQDVVATLGERFQRREYLARVADRWKEWMRQNFLAGGSEQTWPANDPDTAAGKRGQGAPMVLTGKLSRSIFEPRVRLTQDTVTVRPGAPHAHLLQFGVRPHPTTPKAGKFLVFRTATGLVFTRRPVHHPGLQPRRIMPSLPLAKSLAQESLEEYVTDAIREAEQHGGHGGGG